MPASATIVVEHLRKTFSDMRRGEIVAIDDVSFTANAGEIFGLLGPNGAGKTTAMRILSTVLAPTAGRAMVAGFDVATASQDVRRHIGFVSNNTALYDRMSAWEIVEYFGRLYGLTLDHVHERMEKIFTTLQMNDFRDLLVAKMSTGMKQKVSIARAIVHDPPVLIFDEPTTGLDVMVARNVLETVRLFREQGKCVLYSTHIMREVEKLCDRIAFVHHGRIMDQGPINEVRCRHQQDDVEEIFFKLAHCQPTTE